MTALAHATADGARTTAIAPAVLVHDDSSAQVLQALRSVLPQGTPEHTLADAADSTWLRALPAGTALVVMFDQARIDAALSLQDRALAHGLPLLAVGLEPGVASIGPWVAPGGAHEAGCLGCHAVWTGTNLRQDVHWSAPEARRRALPQPPARASQAPANPAARAALAALLQHAVLEPQAFRGRVQRLHLRELTTTTHRVWHQPTCVHCAALPPDSAERAQLQFAPRPLARPGDTRVPNPLLHTAAVREAFVDARAGLMHHVFQDITSDLMPMVAAEMKILGTRPDIEVGYGRTETRGRSELVAMLEVLERFCGHEPRRSACAVRGSYEQVSARFPGQVVDPRDFVLHEAWQHDAPGFDLETYSPALPFDWSWGWSMRRGAPVLVPSQLVYFWQDSPAERPLNRYAQDSSSGCAMGGCMEEAVLYGLFELLERDAYLTSWYGRITPRPIDLAMVADTRVQSLVARSRAQGFELHVFDMRLDIDVPLVWALIVDPADDAPVKSYCASAAHFQWEQAVFSALVEVTTSMGVYRRTMPARRDRALELLHDAGQVRTMPDHVLLYSLPQAYERLSFLFGGQPTLLPGAEAPAATDLQVEMQRRVAQALQVASDVIVVDLTWTPMHRLGLHCVKVLAPGLTPVTFGHQYRRVSLPRLNGARAARGLAPIAADGINPDPHNFP